MLTDAFGCMEIDVRPPDMNAEMGKDSVSARAPAPAAPLQGERRVVELPQREDHGREDRYSGRDGDGGEPRQRLLRRHAFAAVVGLVFLTLAAPSAYLYWDYTGHFQATDDAFVTTRQFAIAPEVSGYIVSVLVTDNEHVNAGDAIARLDDRDYRIALEQAQAQVAGAEDGIQDIDAQMNVQQAQVNANEAQVNQAQAALVFAQQQAARYEDLARKGAGTVQSAQQYSSQLQQRQAALETAQANLEVSQRQIDSLKVQRKSAEARLAQTQAERDRAQLNLSYTIVRAAQPGRVVNLSGAVGQFAQAGTDLTTFVPDRIWVTANFKETQLDPLDGGFGSLSPVLLSPSRRPVCP